MRVYLRVSRRGFVSGDATLIRLYCTNSWAWNAGRRRRDLVLTGGNVYTKAISALEFAPAPNDPILTLLPEPPWLLHVLFSEWGLNDPMVMALHPEGTDGSGIDYVIKNPSADLRCHPFITASWDAEDEMTYNVEAQNGPRITEGSTALAKMDFEKRKRQRQKKSVTQFVSSTRLLPLPHANRYTKPPPRASQTHESVLDKMPMLLVAALQRQFGIEMIASREGNKFTFTGLKVYATRSYLSVGWLVRDIHAASEMLKRSNSAADPLAKVLSKWRSNCKWEAVQKNGDNWESESLDKRTGEDCVIV